jgi:hypothetical protein
MLEVCAVARPNYTGADRRSALVVPNYVGFSDSKVARRASVVAGAWGWRTEQGPCQSSVTDTVTLTSESHATRGVRA